MAAADSPADVRLSSGNHANPCPLVLPWNTNTVLKQRIEKLTTGPRTEGWAVSSSMERIKDF
jgi:hypothetical protein